MTTKHRAPMVSGVTQMWTHPIQLCLQWQADVVKALEPLATGWLERQRDAVISLNSIQRQWFEAAAQRLTADFGKLAERPTSPSCEAASASRDATQFVAEAATSNRPAAQVKTAGRKKASRAKTKANSMAKTESAGEAKVETASEAKIEPTGEAIAVTLGAEVGQLETPATTEAKVEVAA